MLFDQIEHYKRYVKTNENIKAALEFLNVHREDKELADGKYDIIPDQVTAYVVEKHTVLSEQASMEIHKKFMDIHYMLVGQERCGLVEIPINIEEAKYDEDSDLAFFEAEDSNTVVAHQGEFYAVWPYEPHRPLCCVGSNSEKVRKIICKVRV